VRAHLLYVFQFLAGDSHKVLADSDIDLPLHCTPGLTQELKIMEKTAGDGVLYCHHNGIGLYLEKVLEGGALYD
jgi:hypothetical protein